MSDFLVTLITGVLTVIIILTIIYILLQRTFFTITKEKKEKLKEKYSVFISDYLAGKSDCHKLSMAKKNDYLLMEELLLENMEKAKGPEQEKLSSCLDDLGYIDLELYTMKRSNNWWIRVDAAYKLGLMKNKKAVDSLTKALADPVDEVALAAAASLGELKQLTSLKEIIPLFADSSRWSTYKLIEITSAMGEKAVDYLLEILPQVELNTQLKIIEVVGELKVTRAVKNLESLMADESEEKRIKVVKALGQIGDVSVGGLLINALGDSSWTIRAMAAKSLGLLGYEKAIPDLVGLVNDKEWWVKVNSAEALKNMGQAGEEALKNIAEYQKETAGLDSQALASQMLQEKKMHRKGEINA